MLEVCTGFGLRILDSTLGLGRVPVDSGTEAGRAWQGIAALGFPCLGFGSVGSGSALQSKLQVAALKRA